MINSNKINIDAFRHLYPFSSNYIQVRGLNYHYLDEGSGDPVVMVHGNPTWSFYFRELVSAFSGSHRVIVPDHIGCGLSDKPTADQYDFRLKSRIEDLETLLDRLKIRDRITLILHDWGGMIGSAFAVKYPERIKRIIVMNTAGFFPPGSKKIPLRLWLIRNLSWFARPAVLGLNLFSRGALYLAPYKRLPENIKKGLVAPYNRPRHRLATLKFVQDIPLIPGDESYDIVDHVDQNLKLLAGKPVLIMWGLHDFVFDKDYFDEWRRRFPDARSHLFTDAGHYLLEDVPDRIILKIQNFFTENPL